jgi:hypothetical protein
MQRTFTFVFAAFAATAFAGCFGVSEFGDGPIPAENEVAMAPGSTITAVTVYGTISIKAGNGLNRCYTWDDETRCVEMWPRLGRWLGSMGIYFPAPGEPWADNHGVTRGVLEEGVQWFSSVDEASAWMKKNGTWVPFVFRNDGLAVAFRKEPSRRQMNVDVWQIMINGVKPTALPGADDRSITVEEPK